MSASDPLSAFRPHDHARCRQEAVRRAEAACHGDGLRLTALRRRVLEILLEEHRARGAYEILERLRQEGLARQPPQVYRALDFLIGAGLVHRIPSLNAFVACLCAGEGHVPLFLVCTECRAVAEAVAGPEVRCALDDAARGMLRPSRASIEMLGLCPGCADAETAEDG